MTDLRKAAEMALEFVDWLCGDDHSIKPKNSALEAREALRQALAHKEEPVACIGTNGELMWLKKPKVIYSQAQPLYTAPPKREWVGLTDDEIGEMDGAELKYIGTGEYVIDGEYEFAKAIEAKLKEKNT